MIIEDIFPQSIDWTSVSGERTHGEEGFAIIKSKRFGDIQIRNIEYSKDYKADDWCDKGHIVYVIRGELIIEYKDRESHNLKLGITYLVGDNNLPHKAVSKTGATVLIID